ncbi:MAG: hypothetical protein ACFCD0_04285 [Gemmataceae bacterium]
MIRTFFGFVITLAVFLMCSAIGSPVHAQDEARNKAQELKRLELKAEEEYRLYYKQPKTVIEHWTAINFEIKTGKFDIAEYLLQRMLGIPLAGKKDIDAFAGGLVAVKDAKGMEQYLKQQGIDLKGEFINDLLKIEEVKGMEPFLRLRRMPFWNKRESSFNDRGKRNAEALVNLVQQILELRLSDPVRLRKFITQSVFAKTPQERAFAFAKILRSNDRATPYLVEALQKTVNDPVDHEDVKNMILRLRKSALLPMLEILKPAPGKNPKANLELRTTVLELLDRAKVRQAAPYLWYLGADKKTPSAELQAKAKIFLSEIFGRVPASLPKSQMVLSELAENFYQHRIQLNVVPKKGPARSQYGVNFWNWDGSSISVKPNFFHPLKLEYMYGIRFAREALNLDPTSRPAQITLLSLLLDQQYGQQLNTTLYGNPDLELTRLLARVDEALLLATLEKALNENNAAVVLPVVKALGDRSSEVALRAGGTAKSKGIVRALYYPNRRVQMAASRAAINVTSKEKSPVVTARVVNILSRFARTKFRPTIIALGFSKDDRNKPRTTLETAGYFPLFQDSLAEALDFIHKSPDVEAILLHQSTLPNVRAGLTSLKNDSDAGKIPVIFFGDAVARKRMERVAQDYQRIGIEAPVLLADSKAMIETIETYRLLAIPPDSYFAATGIQSDWLDQMALSNVRSLISSFDKVDLALESMALLSDMTKGSIKGYPTKLAKEAFLDGTYRYNKNNYLDQAVSSVKKDFGGKLPPKLDEQIKANVFKIAEFAVQSLARIPGTDVQRRLAEVAVDKSLTDSPQRFALRASALSALNQHIQTNFLVLTQNQILQLEDASKEFTFAKNIPPEDVLAFQQQLAALMGRQDVQRQLAIAKRQGLGSRSLRTGQTLRDFGVRKN